MRRPELEIAPPVTYKGEELVRVPCDCTKRPKPRHGDHWRPKRLVDASVAVPVPDREAAA